MGYVEGHCGPIHSNDLVGLISLLVPAQCSHGFTAMVRWCHLLP